MPVSFALLDAWQLWMCRMCVCVWSSLNAVLAYSLHARDDRMKGRKKENHNLFLSIIGCFCYLRYTTEMPPLKIRTPIHSHWLLQYTVSHDTCPFLCVFEPLDVYVSFLLAYTQWSTNNKQRAAAMAETAAVAQRSVTTFSIILHNAQSKCAL